MRYYFPKLLNYVTFTKTKNNSYILHNHLFDEYYEFENPEFLKFAKALDGKTHPYSMDVNLSAEERGLFLDFLYTNNLVCFSRLLYTGNGDFLLPIIPLKKPSAYKKTTAKIYNALLSVLFIPIFVLGLYLFFQHSIALFETDIFQTITGIIFGLVSSIVAHEISHAIANIAYNGRNLEFGLMLSHYILPGAYVMMSDEKKIKNRFHRIQIDAAGIEQNFMIAGVLFILSCIPVLNCFCIYVAITNSTLALVNLMHIQGLDGYYILNELLGSDDIVEQAKTIIKGAIKTNNRKTTSRAKLVSSCFVLMLQVEIPILIIMNLWGVISCFV